MSAPTAPRTGLPTITVAVFDSATVFEGLSPSDVVYRYDLPGSGVLEGWAGATVVDQVRQLAAHSWPDVQVRIDADADATEILQRLFANKGIPCSAVEEDEPPEAEDPDTGEFPAVGRHRLRGGAGLSRPAALAVMCVVLVLLVVAGYAATRMWLSRPEPPAPVEEVASSSSSAPTPPTTPPPVPVPSEVELRHGNWTVSLPPGFGLEQAEDSVIATGEDPELRIHLTSDPLYSVDKDVLFDEIERLVGEDPQLSEPDRGAQTMSYVEDPGDGSRVRWTTWVENGNQLSVGCHTRQAPSVGQHAACSMATNSFTTGGG